MSIKLKTAAPLLEPPSVLTLCMRLRRLLSPPRRQPGQARAEEQPGAGLGNGGGERKIYLKDCWTSAAFTVHQLKREVARRSRVSYKRCCGCRGTRVESQVETTDDQCQTIIMSHGEHLPIRDRDVTQKFEEGSLA